MVQNVSGLDNHTPLFSLSRATEGNTLYHVAVNSKNNTTSIKTLKKINTKKGTNRFKKKDWSIAFPSSIKHTRAGERSKLIWFKVQDKYTKYKI